MSGLLLYALLSSAIWTGLSRAKLTEPLWSRYPERVAAFMDCPMCVGPWVSAGLAMVMGWERGVGFLGLDPHAFYLPLIAWFCGAVWTPIVAYLQHETLARLNGTSLTAKE